MGWKSVVDIKRLWDINFIVTLISLVYVLFLSIYYGLQEQVDFKVFWTAGRELLNGENPYLKENQGEPGHPLLNSPTSLFLYGMFGLFDLQIAAVVYRLMCVGVLLMLALFISRKIELPFNLIFPFLALSTPFRTNLGSGQVSLLAATSFVYIVLSFYNNQKINKYAIVFSLFVILTFKPYMFPAAIFLLILKNRVSLILFGVGTFIIGIGILELRLNMIHSWIQNTSKIRELSMTEANNSSIISIVSRLTNHLSIGIVFYISINILLFILILKFKVMKIVLPAILSFSLVSSIYVHHQDYLLALVALIILLAMMAQTNSKIIDIFQVGLQPNSLVLHIATFSLRILQFYKTKPSSYSWYPLILSFVSAVYWYQGNLHASFLIYDLVYMSTVFLILIKIYRVRKSNIIS
jgi:hypothetical protein